MFSDSVLRLLIVLGVGVGIRGYNFIKVRFGMFMIQCEFNNIEKYTGIFFFIYSNSERETGRGRERVV